jgi:uncharacterized protein involved in exopolysaccharide biosynthesis
MAENTENLTIRNVLNMIAKRWVLVVMAAIVFAIATLVYFHSMPLEYTGTAIFERRLDIGASQDQTALRGSESFEAGRLKMKQMLAGINPIKEAIEQLNMTRGLSRESSGQLTTEGERLKQKLVDQVMQKVKVRLQDTSPQVDYVAVSYTDSNPKLAEIMPNTLVSNYINRVIEESLQQIRHTREYYAGRVQNCQNEYSELVKQRISFEIDNVGLLPDDPSALYAGLTRLTTDLDTLRLQNGIAKQKLVGLEEMAPKGLGPSEDPNSEDDKPMEVHWGRNPDYDRLAQELREAKKLLRKESINKFEDHPDIEMIHQLIADLEEQLAQTPQEAIMDTVYGTNSQGSQLAIEVLTARATTETTEREIERMQKRLESHQNLLSNFGPIRKEWMDLTKKLDDKQSELSKLEDQLQDYDTALAMEVAKRRVHLNAIQPAPEQFYPSSPSFKKVLLFALAGGVAFGIGLIVLALRLDRSIISPEQASRVLGIPVYGFVDVIMTPGQRTLQWLRRWIVSPILLLILGISLLTASFSLHLRLNAPDQFELWKAKPVQYISEQMDVFLDKIPDIGS